MLCSRSSRGRLFLFKVDATHFCQYPPAWHPPQRGRASPKMTLRKRWGSPYCDTRRDSCWKHCASFSQLGRNLGHIFFQRMHHPR